MSRITIGSIFISLLICGCVSLGKPSPEMKQYDFGPGRAQQLSLQSNQVFLGSINMQDGLDSRMMAYRLIYRDPNQIGTYTLSNWKVSPSKLIQARFIEATGVPTISQSNTLTGGCALAINVQFFEQRFLTESNAVAVVDWLVSIINTKTRRLVAEKRITVLEPMTSLEASGGVKALISATDQAIDKTVNWFNEKVILQNNICEGIK